MTERSRRGEIVRSLRATFGADHRGMVEEFRFRRDPVPCDIDAVAVPTRGDVSLLAAARYAVGLNCPLRVYPNPGSLEPWVLAELEAVPDLILQVYEQPTNYTPEILNFRTNAHPMNYKGLGDLGRARSTAVIQAYLAGEKRILMLDDDIEFVDALQPSALNAISAGMTNTYAMVGFQVSGFLDRSVLGHLRTELERRLSGNAIADDPFLNEKFVGNQQRRLALSGSAVLLNPQEASSHSPRIYGEDWLASLGPLRQRRAGIIEGVVQKPRERFDPDRASREEFGELIVDGLFAAVRENLAFTDLDEWFWERAIEKGTAYLLGLASMLDLVREQEAHIPDADPPLDQLADALDAARTALRQVSVQDCVSFSKNWRLDEIQFQAWLAALPPMSVRESADYLGLLTLVRPAPRASQGEAAAPTSRDSRPRDHRPAAHRNQGSGLRRG